VSWVWPCHETQFLLGWIGSLGLNWLNRVGSRNLDGPMSISGLYNGSSVSVT